MLQTLKSGIFKGGGLLPRERHSRDTRDDSTVTQRLGLGFCASLAQIFFFFFFCFFFFWLPSSRQTECSNRFFAQRFGAQIFAPIFG